jgi:hypothetical protein
MSETEEEFIQIDKMSVDQFAGAVVLILGAVGSLLLVIWQSRCACRCRIGLSDHCYLFDCSREPPSDEQTKKLKDLKKKNDLKKEEKKEEENPSTPREPEPEPEIEKLV